MSDKLSDEIKDKIIRDAEELTKGFKDTNDYEAGIIQGYKEGYEDAGEKYAALWQAAEEKAARYEKALKVFAHRLKEHCEKMGITSVVLQRITIDMEEFTLTPKTDEE